MFVLDFHAYVKNEGQKVLNHAIMFFDEDMNPTPEETNTMIVSINSNNHFYTIQYIVNYEGGTGIETAYKFYDEEQDLPEYITEDVIKFLNSDIDYFNLLTKK